MTSEDWNTPWAKAIGMFLDGSRAEEPDYDFYVAFNPHSEPIPFTIPIERGGVWTIVVNTAGQRVSQFDRAQRTTLCVAHHSMLVLRKAS